MLPHMPAGVQVFAMTVRSALAEAASTGAAAPAKPQPQLQAGTGPVRTNSTSSARASAAPSGSNGSSSNGSNSSTAASSGVLSMRTAAAWVAARKLVPSPTAAELRYEPYGGTCPDMSYGGVPPHADA